jgi:cobalt-zinc-cadmium efflux system membrane fusion protein
MTTHAIIHTAIAAMFVAAFSNISFGADEHDHTKPVTTATAKAETHDEHDDHADDAHDDHADDAHDDHGDGHSDEVKIPEAAIAASGIKIGTASKRNLTASFVAPSRVAFNGEAMAHVGSVVSGRVVEIKVRVGDKIKKDDVLLVVESPELGKAQSDFLQRKTEKEIAESAVEPTKDAYQRAKQLFDESQGIAFSEVQRREVEYRAAVGNAASTKAAMLAAENGLHLLNVTQEQIKTLTETGEIHPRFEIRAPIDGQVIEREVTLGELVSPDKEKLLVVADTSTYWVLADVPEMRLADVIVGSKAEVQLAALPGERIAGEVSLISAEVDPNTRSARLRIVVENRDNQLRPGMFARSLIQAGKTDAPPILAIPEESVQTVEGGPSVFVLVEGEPNTFARRSVVVGRAVNGYVPVISGLKDGEQLVIAGTFILKAELGKSEAAHEH